MFIELDHPMFSSVELRGKALIVHSMQAGPRVLRENVQDLAVALQGSLLRVVAFTEQDQAWFFSGEDELHSERLDLGAPYGGGGRLICDGLGTCHLFYFVRQSPGLSSLLRHQRFTDSWSKAQTVTANVFGELWGYSVSWHSDQYLHLAYLGHKDRRLLYRVYDLEHGLWSGAVTVSEATCAHPQFLSAGTLHLFWLEELDRTVLKVRSKKEHWSAPLTLSTGGQHAGLVGFALNEGEWSVLWGEGSDFYQTPLDRWEERGTAERGDFEYLWKVQGGITLPMYIAKGKREAKKMVEPPAVPGEPEPAAEEPPRELEPTPEDTARRRREQEEARAQAAFMEQAFRTLQEWERVREEVRRWQQELKAPPPVDLTPLTARLERLERRLMNLQKAQEAEKALGETSRAQLDRELTRLKARLDQLEEEKPRRRSFWWRVLGRA